MVCDVDRKRLRADGGVGGAGESMVAAYEVRRGAPELAVA